MEFRVVDGLVQFFVAAENCDAVGNALVPSCDGMQSDMAISNTPEGYSISGANAGLSNIESAPVAAIPL